jgi:long-chain acyl-CoA synthetase
MTETTGPIACLPPEDHDVSDNTRMRSAGKPLKHVELRIRLRDGSVAGVNESGEIETRSELTVSGYWNLPQASKQAFTQDGWLRTGDVGYLDQDGYLYIQGRVQDMIFSGGENVDPTEVEEVISGYPGVADVAIIGLPSMRWGAVVKAIVVPASGARIGADDIIDYARSRIAHFKVPKSVDFIDRLPRDANGKVLRRQLRKRYWHGLDRDMK